MNLIQYIIIFSCLSLMALSSENLNLSENGVKMFKKVYDQCVAKSEVLKCFKINALKIVDRALHSRALSLIDGVTLIGDETTNPQARSFQQLNETALEGLPGGQIDGMILDTAARFLSSHKLQINVPSLVEEGRKKKHKNHGGAALLWALAIKGSFLAMAYKGIAIMAGTALIVGKMALLLSAILGLKKLVSSGHEKTTFEIVKHPSKHTEYTHSTSYEDDGHYRRSFDDLDSGYGLKLAYNDHIPKI